MSSYHYSLYYSHDALSFVGNPAEWSMNAIIIDGTPTLVDDDEAMTACVHMNRHVRVHRR